MIKSFIKSLINFFNRASMSDEERYLSDSIDLADLEERQQKIKYGKAPYQINGRHWLDSRQYQ